MNFFKKRKTAWALLAITVVVCFFVGQAKSGSKKIVEPGRIWVNDTANVLSDSDEKYINEMVNGLYGQSKGSAIYVETVKSTYGQDPYDTCISIAGRENAQSESCVFLVAVDDVAAQIVPGESLKYWFTDDELTGILYENMSESDFPGRLDQAIIDCFDDLIDMYEDYHDIDVDRSSQIVTVKESASDSYSSRVFTMVIAVMVIILIVRMFLKPSPPRRYRPWRSYRAWGNYPRTGSYNRTDFGNRSSGSSFGSSSRGGSFRGSGSSSGSSFSSSRGGSFRGSGSSSGSSFGGGSRGGSFRGSSGSSRGGSFRGK